MHTFDLKEHPHTIKNLLTGEWILVSPHRTKRPWQGKVETLPADDRPSYDEKCYLCPGNTRAEGSVNPSYTDSFVFTNDFSALLSDTPEGEVNVDGLLQALSQKGICRVISLSPTIPLPFRCWAWRVSIKWSNCCKRNLKSSCRILPSNTYRFMITRARSWVALFGTLKGKYVHLLKCCWNWKKKVGPSFNILNNTEKAKWAIASFWTYGLCWKTLILQACYHIRQ